MCRGKQNTVLLVKDIIRHLVVSRKDRHCIFLVSDLLCSVVVISCFPNLENRKDTIRHPASSSYNSLLNKKEKQSVTNSTNEYITYQSAASCPEGRLGIVLSVHHQSGISVLLPMPKRGCEGNAFLEPKIDKVSIFQIPILPPQKVQSC